MQSHERVAAREFVHHVVEARIAEVDPAVVRHQDEAVGCEVVGRAPDFLQRSGLSIPASASARRYVGGT
jgi:hypothetical protein